MTPKHHAVRDRTRRHLGVLLALALALTVSPVRAADAEASVPVVRVLLFYYAEQCVECDVLFEYLLPALHARFPARLEMAALDVSGPEAAAVYRTAAALGLPADGPRVPAAVVADRALVGLDAIASTLGDGFDLLAANVAAGQWPALAGLSPLLPQALRTVQARLSAAPGPDPVEARGPEPWDRDRMANALAVGVLAGMVAALLHSLVRVGRPGRDGRGGAWPVALAALVGIGISAYTAYTSLAGVTPVCGPIGSCDLVQQSEYAKLFGIPLGVLGALGYAGVLGTWVAARRLSPAGGGWRWLPWAIAFGGVLFSTRLTALEPFVIGHTCLWCLGSAVTMTSILWLLSGQVRPAATAPT